MRKFTWLPAIIIVLASCSSAKKIGGDHHTGITGLRFINEYTVPHGLQFGQTEVGGLSGIDYNASADEYYLICDDPSARGSARFYTAKLRIDDKGIDTVVFTGVTTILNRDGKPYADITKDLLHSADLESMRYDPVHRVFVRGSEGQRRVRGGNTQLQQPDIIIMDPGGKWIDSFPLPANLKIQATENGPRHNSVFEGLDFDEKYQKVYVCVEEALHNDWPRAGNGDSTSWIRVAEFDMKSRKQLVQYAYEIGPVPHPANSPGAFKINGVSDIMHLGNKKFIVIERAFSTGRTETDIKIYLADAAGAEDISSVTSISEHPVAKPITKKLLLDMNEELQPEVFNVEGVTWGPRLANGHRTLVFVTDNNFNPKEKTQFFLFEVLP